MRELRARQGAMCKLVGCEHAMYRHARARYAGTRGREVRAHELQAPEVPTTSTLGHEDALCEFGSYEHARERWASLQHTHGQGHTWARWRCWDLELTRWELAVLGPQVHRV